MLITKFCLQIPSTSSQRARHIRGESFLGNSFSAMRRRRAAEPQLRPDGHVRDEAAGEVRGRGDDPAGGGHPGQAGADRQVEEGERRNIGKSHHQKH